MIRSKEDYKFYVESDLAALGHEAKPSFCSILYPIITFQLLLRKIEYYQNCKHDFFHKFYLMILKVKYRKLAMKLGFSIPYNVFGPGLNIAHYGSVIVNDNAIIGENCRIHSCVNIGTGENAPIIGNNVYIGPGAKIWGKITIGDNVAIGANSVVNKSIESNVTVAGIPARIISTKGSKDLIICGTEIVRKRKDG